MQINSKSKCSAGAEHSGSANLRRREIIKKIERLEQLCFHTSRRTNSALCILYRRPKQIRELSTGDSGKNEQSHRFIKTNSCYS
jgi:hypothetical protein